MYTLESDNNRFKVAIKKMLNQKDRNLTHSLSNNKSVPFHQMKECIFTYSIAYWLPIQQKLTPSGLS